ncbi:MAG: sigma-70 family RNA polymerase sigma factor [Rikenellaceae bacterium]
MEIEKYIVESDQRLVDMALDGDAVAFEQLFDRYRNSIHQIYAQRMEGFSDQAGDLLQETFIKVYLNLSNYDSRYTFGQWVYTIARNTFIDYARRRRDDLSVDSYIVEGTSNFASTPTPEQEMINEQSRKSIEFFMSKMSSRYRTLIELRFFKEYSYEEIANELQLPMGTVKTQIHRAREQLCKILAGSGEF